MEYKVESLSSMDLAVPPTPNIRRMSGLRDVFLVANNVPIVMLNQIEVAVCQLSVGGTNSHFATLSLVVHPLDFKTLDSIELSFKFIDLSGALVYEWSPPVELDFRCEETKTLRVTKRLPDGKAFNAVKYEINNNGGRVDRC